MAMTKTEKDALAKARLEAHARACDGCGERIGRWTKKCQYDVEHDRCYCSTGGCAAQVIAAPLCVGSCLKYLNPFEMEFEDVIGVGLMCSTCTDSLGGTDEALAGLKIVPIERARTRLTRDEIHAAENGPYVVIEHSQGWYQVVLPLRQGMRNVRAAMGDAAFAFRKCGEFNQAA